MKMLYAMTDLSKETDVSILYKGVSLWVCETLLSHVQLSPCGLKRVPPKSFLSDCHSLTMIKWFYEVLVSSCWDCLRALAVPPKEVKVTKVLYPNVYHAEKLPDQVIKI